MLEMLSTVTGNTVKAGRVRSLRSAVLWVTDVEITKTRFAEAEKF